MNSSLFLLQLAIILASVQVVSRIVRKLGQPQVVGEIIAGLLLGPSFFGWIAPSLFLRLFPADSLGYLNVVSQLGLIIFMFLVGLKLESEHIRRESRLAMVAGTASVLAPFAAGVAVAFFVPADMIGPRAAHVPFLLFMGAAVSITAFPVLARILTEQGLFETRLGTIAISCAAVNDVSAWTILAGIVSLTEHGRPVWQTIALFTFYVAIVMAIVRPLVRRMPDSDELVRAIALLVLLASASATEAVGVHALFGAFFAGVIFPQGHHRVERFAESVEPVVTSLFLPVFFAFTGLRTSVLLINTVNLWAWAVLIVLVAVAGKVGGALLGARSMGLPKKESMALGVLLNTRGLVELVILNVGLELGILSNTLFAIMVLMAVVTTLMTTPWLRAVLKDRPVLKVKVL